MYVKGVKQKNVQVIIYIYNTYFGVIESQLINF